MNIIIRQSEEKDFDEIKSILEKVFEISKKNHTTGEQYYEIVAEVDSNVAGYVLLTKVMNPNLDGFYYLIDYVSVDSDYRGLSLAEQMLKHAEEYAKEKGAMYLQLTCGKQRIAAHHVYEKCGFEKRDSDVFRKEIV